MLKRRFIVPAIVIGIPILTWIFWWAGFSLASQDELTLHDLATHKKLNLSKSVQVRNSVDRLDSAIAASWLELAFGPPELASYKPTFVLEGPRWSVNFLRKDIIIRRKTAIFGWLQRKIKKSKKIQSAEDDLRTLTEILKNLETPSH